MTAVPPEEPSPPTRRVLLVAGGGLADALSTEPALAGLDVTRAAGRADALQQLRARDVDVVVTDPSTSVHDDLAFVSEVRDVRRCTRIVVLAPTSSQQDVIAAIRAHVFALVTAPFEAGDLANLIADAASVDDWRHGIEVISGLPHWISLRVSSRRVTAERLVRFMTEYRSDLPDADRQNLMTAFRELLLNAMEHGARFDPDKVIEVSAARTARAIVYYFRDPGPGFSRGALAHAAVGHRDGDPIAHFDQRMAMGLRPGGFGILLARKLVDELVYNERGNEVILVKYTDRPDTT
jgi:anti-sigma regulatory factor (Ser/Thr protein kinase)